MQRESGEAGGPRQQLVKIDRRAFVPLLGAGATYAFGATTAHARTTDPAYRFARGFPAADATRQAYDAIDLRRAIEAYKFFYPTVGTEAVMQQPISPYHQGLGMYEAIDYELAAYKVPRSIVFFDGATIRMTL